MKRFQLNRRAFLGGAGAALALPMLEAMAPFASSRAFAETTPSPRRMLAYYVPNGFHMPSFTPTDEGPGFTLSETLAPLANVRDDLLVVSGLENAPANPDGAGDHAAGTGSFLTATHVYKTGGSDIRNGISVDQVAAQALKEQTRYASLELGMDGGGSTGDCDSGYSCAYTTNISWAGPQTPMPKTVDPQIVFDRLFAGFDPQATAAERAKRQRYQKSVLDYALDDTAKLQAKLGARDRQKLDEFMTGVRTLEERIAGMDGQARCGVPDRPGSNYDLNGKSDVMADLMVLAFQCDLTRVQSFMLSNAGSSRSYGFLGVSESHHQVSHHQSLQSNFDKLKIINRWEIERFAYLVERLKATTDPDGTPLLDTCTVFLSSEISDGDHHNHDNMPIVLAGKGGGAFTTGRHVRYPDGGRVSDLFISMLGAVGVNVSTFGDDGTGPLPGL